MSILGTAADFGCDVNLLLQTGILGVLLIGLIFGRSRTSGALHRHRTVMTTAVAANLAGFAYVMAPSMLSFFSSTPVPYLSLWGVTSIPHGILGGVSLVLGSVFTANLLPKKNLRGWMRATFLLWLTNVILGITLYLQMAHFI
jgi:uncharacterized membrane protein YozB (DUF420 family)